MDDFDRYNDLDLNTDDMADDELPDLPSRHDEAYAADEDYLPDEAEQDAYLHPEDMDLDEYLSYDEYEEQGEAEPEPVQKREPESAKKKGGLFGFLKRRGAEAPAGEPNAEPVETDGSYPDSDPAAVGLLKEFRERLAAVSAAEYTHESLEALFMGFIEEKQIKPAQLIHALRVAATGKGVGIGMFEALELLGRERTLKRIDRVLALLNG